MGYYAAGGTQLDKGLMVSHPVSPSASANAAAAGEEAPYRRKTQVINLTALRHAFRRVDRATRVAHKLFAMKKQGTHGLKFKAHKRKKGI